MKASYHELQTVKQLVTETLFLTEQKLRWYIFNAETNGLLFAIVKISIRVYIDRVAFVKWVQSHRMAHRL